VFMKSSTFWDITSRSPVKVNRIFEGILALVSISFTQVSCLAYSSILKMEATCYSETSSDFQRTAGHYITEDRALQIIYRYTNSVVDLVQNDIAVGTQ
jgi:hypothetical protein